MIDAGLIFDWTWPHPDPVTHPGLNDQVPLNQCFEADTAHPLVDRSDRIANPSRFIEMGKSFDSQRMQFGVREESGWDTIWNQTSRFAPPTHLKNKISQK